MNISRDGAGIGRVRPAALSRSRAAIGGLLGALSLAALALTACTTPPAPPVAHIAPLAEGGLAVDQFTGLKPKDLLALLGEPNLRRSDPPAELWQYRGTGCVLELYLYREGDAYRVVRAETRGRSLAGDDGCSTAPASLRQSRL